MSKKRIIRYSLNISIVLLLFLTFALANLSAVYICGSCEDVDGLVTFYEEEYHANGSFEYLVKYEYTNVEGYRNVDEYRVVSLDSHSSPLYSIGQKVNVRYAPQHGFSYLVNVEGEQFKFKLLAVFTALLLLAIISRIALIFIPVGKKLSNDD